MSQPFVGFFEYRRERYEFETAIAEWDGDCLTVYAEGNDLLVFFCGIPYGPVADFSQLKGKTYFGSEGDSVFSEGVIRLGDLGFEVKGSAEIRCIAANGEKGTIAIEFEFEIALANQRSRKSRGGAKCILGKIPHWPNPSVDEA